MKRLILITGVVVYILFAVSSFIAIAQENQDTVTKSTVFVETSEASNPIYNMYTLTESKGVIVVRDNRSGKIIKKTDTLVSLLPQGDQKKLKKGIKAKNERELNRLLEDFCS